MSNRTTKPIDQLVAELPARVVETRIKEVPLGDHNLRVHEHWVSGQLQASVFTLESLAYALDIPMSTMEGRYKRARLSKWSVPVINGYGRPVRGFPYELLQAVIVAITHPRGYVKHDAQGSTVAVDTRKELSPLMPEYFLGERYFTVPALAHAFGYSETTVRKKLRDAGLMRRFQNLASPTHGGRPKRGIHNRYIGQVKLVLDGTTAFVSKHETALRRATGELQVARNDMMQAMPDHTPPQKGDMQAWDAYHMTPVHKVPVGETDDDFSERHTPDTGKPADDYSDDPAMADLMATVDAALAMQAHLPPYEPTPPNHQTVERSEQPEQVTTTLVNDVNSEPQFTSLPTDEQARKAERELEAANRAKLVPVQRQMLIDDVDDPTDEELSDTCYALDLKGDAAKAFVQSVREGRRQRVAASAA